MKKFVVNNKDYVIIGIVSLIAFIVGCLSVKPIIAILVVGIADMILFIPNLLKNRKIIDKGRHAEFRRKKEKHVTEKPKKKKKKKVLKILIFIFLIMCILGIIGICAFAAYIAKTSPKFDPKKLYHQEASTFYDGSENEMAKVGTENREIITYEELPEVLIDAIVATEDSRFYQHNGVDLPRFMKATFQTLLGSSNAGGASTLTMQLVKNHYTSREKSIVRKFKDVYISVSQIEKKYTKEQILEYYVNAPYLGARAYGVEQACKTYFGKSAKDINLAEAAMIAGLFQSPGADDPTRNPERAEKRRQVVLKLMERHGYITKEEREIASKMTVDKLLADKHENMEDTSEYQAFLDTVLEDLTKQDPDGKKGINPYYNALEIYTTMDREKQEYINKIMYGEIWDWKDDKVTAGIAVIDNKNGDILAVGTGRNKEIKRGLNNATQLNNQIGSTAKPLYDYSIGIEYENWSTYEPMTDENITYSDGTELNNWDGGYQGYLTLRNALAQSRNTSAVKAFRKNNKDNIKEAVTKMGLHPEEYLHEAHAIGGYTGEYPVATAAAYATFGNDGVYNKPRSWYKIVNKNTGEVINNETESTKVFSPQTAYIMTDLLQSSAKVGLGAYSNINGCVYGAKTGTSNFASDWLRQKGLPSNTINDYWVSGVSPDYAVSVWYGYDKLDIDKDHHNSFGTTYHERLFQLVGKGIFKKGSTFKNPGGVKSVAVENYTYPAKLPSAYTPKGLIVTELFKSGTEPTETSDRFAKLSSISNLKSKVEGNKLTLTWEGISTPAALDEGKIKSLAEKLFDTKGFQNRFISQIKSYNDSNLGNVIYRIYAKNADGSLNEINKTSNTSVEIILTTDSATTYVVKASYSIFTANMSDGVETTISLDGVKDNIEVKLIGDATMTVAKDQYTESGVQILKNGQQTNLQPTSITYTTSAGTPTTLELMKSTPDKYTITYSYNEFKVTRTVTVQ